MKAMRQIRNRVGRTMLLVAGALTAVSIAFAPAAEARDHKDSDRVHRHSQGRHGGRDVTYVAVPRRIHGDHWGEINHQYAGRAYYRPHHHYHRIYRFPVVVGGVVTYRPYYYCDDQLFVTASVPLPRVVIGFNFTAGQPVYR